MEGRPGAEAAFLVVPDKHELGQPSLLEAGQNVASDADWLPDQGCNPPRQELAGEGIPLLHLELDVIKCDFLQAACTASRCRRERPVWQWWRGCCCRWSASWGRVAAAHDEREAGEQEGCREDRHRRLPDKGVTKVVEHAATEVGRAGRLHPKAAGDLYEPLRELDAP